MPRKIDNNIIDNRLKNKNSSIIRIGDYIDAITKIKWKDTNCNHMWAATPHNIIDNETGCPICNGIHKLSNDDIDVKLIGRGIIRLDDYINNRSKMKWQHVICGTIWSTTSSSILNNVSGCPKCSNRMKITNEIVDEKLILRNIKRLDDVENNYTKYNWQCVICEYMWKTTSHSIVDNESGCPKCAGNLKITNEVIDKKLVSLNIKRLDNPICMNSKHSWQCIICNNIWNTTPSNIIHNGTGCPVCCQNKNEKLIYSLLLNNRVDFNYQKKLKEIIDTNYKYIVDFYISSINSIIEYNGRQHYEPVNFHIKSKSLDKAKINLEKQKTRDSNLEIICKNNNINLIWIDGREYKDKKLEYFVINEIISLTDKKKKASKK